MNAVGALASLKGITVSL